jgi:hypothetical protein
MGKGSSILRDTKPLGYSYPEIVDWGVSSQQLSKNVKCSFK